MQREDSLIPYSAAELTGARILALAAHPDDETFGAGGTLAVNAGKAQAIRVWIATDGTGQEGVSAEDARAYSARRRDEAVRATAALGIDPPRFGGMADRSLADDHAALTAALAAEIEEFQPDLVLCPSPTEIHPDHRAMARALYELVASSRAGDPDHDRFRFLRMGFYELSHPLLPNTLVDIAAVARRKEDALLCFASQQAVRDYVGAMQGLNAYRRLTLSGTGPVEAFRVVTYPEASTTSFEELRRTIGPSAITDGAHGPVRVSVVIRTRNRPALLGEALESLRAQTARPRQVVVVNDGGASPKDVTDGFRDAFDVVLEDSKQRRGRSAAANRGVALATEQLVAFLDDDDRCFPDHLERLTAAQRQGPEPVVYADAVTVVYGQGESGWEPRVRTLQYSLDYDPDYLLLANYIPIHTLLLPRELFRKVGGFDEGLEYSEDWDFLIRLSAETPFRHLRAVTCEYRVFEAQSNDPTHVAAGTGAFQDARTEDLRALRRAAHRRGARAGARPHARAGRVLVRPRRDLAGRAQVPARGAPARERGPPEERGAAPEREVAPDGRERASPRAHGRVRPAARGGPDRGRAPVRNPPADLRVEDVEAAPVSRSAARPAVSGARIAVLAPEPIRPRMAGMGIRALELARALADEFDVRLLVPNGASEAREVAGTLDVVTAREGELAAAAAGAHAAVVSGHAANWWFHQVPDVPVAADLYDPFPVENLHYARALGEETAAHDRRSLALALARADFFLCASPEQRLFYAGALFDAGRIGARNFPDDPTLARLLALVPFGTPAEAAAGDRAAGRRAVGAEGEGPLVLFGGVYDWYDPELLLEAWPHVLRGHPQARLLFFESPNRETTPQRVFERARARARAIDPEGRSILFSRWLPYSARADLYAAADLLVSIASAGLETELAYRTRLLDAAWGGVASVAIGGGTLARELAEAGAAFECGREPGELGRRVSGLLADPARRGAAGAAARAFAQARRWKTVTAPLSIWCRDARVDPGRLPVPAGDGIGERLKNLFR